MAVCDCSVVDHSGNGAISRLVLGTKTVTSYAKSKNTIESEKTGVNLVSRVQVAIVVLFCNVGDAVAGKFFGTKRLGIGRSAG